MFNVKGLTDDLVPLIDAFLHRDPFVNAYAIWDLYFLPHRARFFICLEDGELKGLLLDYLGHTGVHSIWLWGIEEAVEKLLGIPSYERMIFHVPPEFEPIVRRRFTITARYPVDFMLLRRGGEHLYIKHEIRQLTPADAISLTSLRRETPTDKDVEEAKSLIEEQPFYGIFKNGTLISVACIQAKIPEIWIIGGIYTKPEYRNKGYATSLTSFLVKEVLAETEHVGLYVREDNHPAKHIYEKVGFKPYKKMLWLEHGINLIP
jgi:GNAT superfamily N-acetyltransferase